MPWVVQRPSSSGSSLWRPPSRNIVGPKAVLNVLGLSACIWMGPLFSQASFRRLGGQTDRSQKHKGSRSSPHRAAPWLHRAGFSMVRPLPRGHVLGQGCWSKGCRRSSFVSASCPGSCLHVREGEIHTHLTRLYKNKYYNTRTSLGVFLPLSFL